MQLRLVVVVASCVRQRRRRSSAAAAERDIPRGARPHELASRAPPPLDRRSADSRHPLPFVARASRTILLVRFCVLVRRVRRVSECAHACEGVCARASGARSRARAAVRSWIQMEVAAIAWRDCPAREPPSAHLGSVVARLGPPAPESGVGILVAASKPQAASPAARLIASRAGTHPPSWDSSSCRCVAAAVVGVVIWGHLLRGAIVPSTFTRALFCSQRLAAPSQVGGWVGPPLASGGAPHSSRRHAARRAS